MEPSITKAMNELWAALPSPGPDTIRCSSEFYATYFASIVAHELREKGVDWRRVKREERKAYERKLAEIRTTPPTTDDD